MTTTFLLYETRIHLHSFDVEICHMIEMHSSDVRTYIYTLIMPI